MSANKKPKTEKTSHNNVIENPVVTSHIIAERTQVLTSSTGFKNIDNSPVKQGIEKPINGNDFSSAANLPRSDKEEYDIKEIIQEDNSSLKMNDSILYHKKASEYLEKLIKELEEKEELKKIEELYSQVENFEKLIFKAESFAIGVEKSFSECAKSITKETNKNYAHFTFISLLEETFNIITGQFSGQDFYPARLKEYGEGINYAYKYLDQETQKLVGELYPYCLDSNIHAELD